MHFRFAYPILFFLFLPTVVWFLRELKRGHNGVIFSMAGIAIQCSKGKRKYFPRFSLILRMICLSFVILAAARPQTFTVDKSLKTSGMDIILCLDISGSMRAMDFRIDGRRATRLAVVKKVVKEFVKKRQTDRVGAVIFGEKAFTLCPLTLDKRLVFDLIDRLKIGLAGDRTAIGSALALAGKRLIHSKSKSKIVILLTDGRNNAGTTSPKEAALVLKKLGIKIYCIGVGSNSSAPFLIQTFWGPKYVYRTVDLDEVTLKGIATISGGNYFRASDSNQLAEVYNAINNEEKTEFKFKVTIKYKDIYHYFVYVAVFVLFLEVILNFVVARSIP